MKAIEEAFENLTSNIFMVVMSRHAVDLRLLINNFIVLINYEKV